MLLYWFIYLYTDWILNCLCIS